MGIAQETRERSQSVEEPEQKVPIALSGIIDAVVFSVEDISGYNLSPEQKSKLRAIEEKIVELTPKFFRVAKRAVAVGAIIAIGNYYQTHPDLNKSTDETGQTIYTHEDARTTHYLNILAGREKFTEEDLEAERRPAIMDKLREEGIPTPNNIEKLSIDELYTLYYKNTDPSKIEKPDGFKELNRQWAQMINDQITLYRSASKDKNSLVWQLEEECGNPKIRFVTEERLTIAFPKFKDHYKYNPFSNTVYKFWKFF